MNNTNNNITKEEKIQKLSVEVSKFVKNDTILKSITEDLKSYGLEVFDIFPDFDFKTYEVSCNYSLKLNRRTLLKKYKVKDIDYDLKKRLSITSIFFEDELKEEKEENTITKIQTMKMPSPMDYAKKKIEVGQRYSKKDKSIWMQKIENDINTELDAFEKTLTKVSSQIENLLKTKHHDLLKQDNRSFFDTLKDIKNSRKEKNLRGFVFTKIKEMVVKKENELIYAAYKFHRDFWVKCIKSEENNLPSYGEIFGYKRNMREHHEAVKEVKDLKKELLKYLEEIIQSVYDSLLEENFHLQSKMSHDLNIEFNNEFIQVNKKQLFVETLKAIKPIFNKYGLTQSDFYK